MTPRTLTPEDFGEELHQFEHDAFRLELQDQYLEEEEADLFAAWRRGNPYSPTSIYRSWYDRIADHVRAGRRVERVRVQRTPPTPYQQFERWLDQWNIAAGETMRYLARQQAHDIGLLPAAGNTDWWLLDSSKLIVMHFDEHGHRIHNELVTDPQVVTQACTWRDLAVHHSVLPHRQDAPV